MPKYIFFYNQSRGHFNKLEKNFKVPISALTKYAEVEALDDTDLLVKIWGISGLAWKTVGVVLTSEIIACAPYYGDVVSKENGSFFVIDTNGVLAPCDIDTEHISDASIVNNASLFSEVPGGLIPTPENMNKVAAQEQIKRTARNDLKGEKENIKPDNTAKVK